MTAQPTKFGKLTVFQDVAHLSAGQVLERSTSLCPKKVALIYNRERMTYEELNKRVDNFASGIASLGLKKGDRFVIDLPNSPELVISFYALAKLGVITTWCNPVYRQKEVGFILRNSGAKGIIIQKESDGFDFIEMVEEAREGSELEHIITVGGRGRKTFDEVMTSGIGNLPMPLIDSKNDFIKIIYTSGATGIPKGAPYTHYQAIRSGFVYAEALDTSADDIFLAALPLYHSYAFNCLLMQCPSIQATMVLM